LLVIVKNLWITKYIEEFSAARITVPQFTFSFLSIPLVKPRLFHDSIPNQKQTKFKSSISSSAEYKSQTAEQTTDFRPAAFGSGAAIQAAPRLVSPRR
jgi:hypothetical protein